ncbi:MAG: bifunctional oligoribonuclease/PAP phosphatase NrnA [Treponemataceae bacterium]
MNSLETKKPTVSGELISFLSKYKKYIVIGHFEPDGDCICSSLAMGSFLRRHGAEVFLLNEGPFAKTEISEYASFFSKELPQKADKETTGLVIVDCTGVDRVGETFSTVLQGYDTAIIDHHATNTSDAFVGLVQKDAPSTTYLVQAIIEHIDGKVSPYEAELLFFGLSTDTGFFRHLDGRSANVFDATSRLVRAGANPKKTFLKMNGGKSLNSRKILANVLSRLKPFYNGRLMIAYETYEEVCKYGRYSRDSDMTYMIIQGIENVEAMVLIKQEKPTHCTIGFRSLDKIDVSIVAKSFGGGGHIQASGAYVESTVEELIPQIVEKFQPQFTTQE